VTRRRAILLALGAVVTAALAVVAWIVWSEPPPPPPSTAEEVYAAVTEADPSKLSDPRREQWLDKVGRTIDRLPAHEFEKLVRKSMQDPTWRERFRALKPEQRRKMADLISEEKKFAMMRQMVEMVKTMPPPVRKAMFERFREGRKRMRKQGGHPPITKQRLVERLGSTTPTQRARFVRAMREMRKMLEEAGIRP